MYYPHIKERRIFFKNPCWAALQDQAWDYMLRGLHCTKECGNQQLCPFIVYTSVLWPGGKWGQDEGITPVMETLHLVQMNHLILRCFYHGHSLVFINETLKNSLLQYL